MLIFLFSYYLLFFFSYRTTLCLEQRATVIAACALFLTALHLDVKPVPTPNSTVERTWFELLDPYVDPSTLQSEHQRFMFVYCCCLQVCIDLPLYFSLFLMNFYFSCLFVFFQACAWR